MILTQKARPERIERDGYKKMIKKNKKRKIIIGILILIILLFVFLINKYGLQHLTIIFERVRQSLF